MSQSQQVWKHSYITQKAGGNHKDALHAQIAVSLVVHLLMEIETKMLVVISGYLESVYTLENLRLAI
eukprot:2267851-Amphidinium_carterae.1